MGKFEKILIGLVLLITVVNYWDRAAISYAIVSLERELGLSQRQFGWIGSGFGFGYFAMSFFAGWMVDRWGVARVWPASAMVWSLATFFMGFGQGFWSLFGLRVLLGAAEAVHFPALIKVMSRVKISHRSRSLASVLFGVPLSSILGAPVLSLILEWMGWRWMFWLCAGLGMGWACCWLLWFKGERKEEAAVSIKSLVCSKAFVGNALNYFILGYVIFFGLTWLPGYFEQMYGTKTLQTGGILLCPWIVSAILLMVGGVVSDYLWKKSSSSFWSRGVLISGGLLFAAVSFALAVFSSSLFWGIFFLSLGMGGAFFTNAPIFSLNADLSKEKMGTTQGVMTTFFAFSGIVSPIVTGWLIGESGSYGLAILAVSLFCLFGCLFSLALLRAGLRS